MPAWNTDRFALEQAVSDACWQLAYKQHILLTQEQKMLLHACRLNSSSKVFTSASCLDWLQQHEQIQQPEAKQLLLRLLQAHLISILDQSESSSTASGAQPSETQLADAQLQLVREAAPAKLGQALNAHYAW